MMKLKYEEAAAEIIMMENDIVATSGCVHGQTKSQGIGNGVILPESNPAAESDR